MHKARYRHGNAHGPKKHAPFIKRNTKKCK